MKHFLRNFGFPLFVTIGAIGVVFVRLGLAATLTALILAAIELAFSFDNAIINARILAKLTVLWRRVFLSIGIIIAVFLVRMLLPIVIVSLGSHLSFGTILNLALYHPAAYGQKLSAAGPSITIFGGVFLAALSLHFFIVENNNQWITIIERPFRRFIKWWLPLPITGAIVGLLTIAPFNAHHKTTLIAGCASIGTYAILHGVMSLLDRFFKPSKQTLQLGWSAFAAFLYLELLDTTLSFDGVIGAFAITNSVILIGVGLGVGAIWVRSLTLYMVVHKTLDNYKYLENGAYYAITILSIGMLLGAVDLINIPNPLVGFAGLFTIVLSLIASRRRLKRSAPA